MISDVCWTVAIIALSLIMLTTDPAMHKAWVLILALIAAIAVIVGIAFNKKKSRQR